MASLPLRAHSADSVAAQATSRRRELDWLRVLIIVGLIPFHVIGLYSTTIDAYVAGGESSPLISMFVNFLGLWPMSLLFLVAGASAWFALGRRTIWQYARERLLRLLVPFLFATLVIIPIQVYAVVSAYPQLLGLNLVPGINLHGAESLPQFYPSYLVGYAYFLTHFSSTLEVVFWGHLWFIPRLLLYALAASSLLLWLRGDVARRFITWASRVFAARGGILLLGALVALPRVLTAAAYQVARATSPKTPWDPYNLWAQLGVFLIFFLLGYLFYASPQMLDAVRRDGVLALALGVGLFVLLLTPIGGLAPVTRFNPARILIIGLRTESEWLLVVGILAVGLHYLTFRNVVLDYLNEAAYPLYVLHMPVLILVGLGVIRSGLPSVVALSVIVVTTLAVTLGVYDLAIRRVGALRVLFGLKIAPAASSVEAARLVPDMSHRPDTQDDRGVAQPVGKRRVDEATRSVAHPGEDNATHKN